MCGVVVRLLLSALAVLFVDGCQRSEGRYLGRVVVDREIPGVWRMESETVDSLRDVGYRGEIDPAAHVLVFRDDGTCHFRSFLPRIDWDRSPIPVLDSSCRWSLGTSRHQTLEIDLEGRDGRGPYYYFDETSDGRLILWQHLTDPDAWRYLEYVKQ